MTRYFIGTSENDIPEVYYKTLDNARDALKYYSYYREPLTPRIFKVEVTEVA